MAAHRSRRRWAYARIVPWGVVGVLLLALAGPGLSWAAPYHRSVVEVGYATAIPGAAPGPTVLPVNLTDAPAFDPNNLTAPASVNVTLRLSNTGAYDHTFTLSSVPGRAVLKPTWTPRQVDQFFQNHTPIVNVSVAPGATVVVNLSFAPSQALNYYQYVSVVPYQFQAGMAGVFYVSGGSPSYNLTESTTDSLSFLPNELAVLNVTHFPVIAHVVVTNTGTFSHTFTVSPLANYTISVANYTSFFFTNTPLISLPVPSGAGSTVAGNLTIRGPGVYEYICLIPGHFAAGMYGFLYVNLPPPPPPPAPSTALIQGWLLGIAAIFLGVALVLAFAVSYIGRRPREPTPVPESPASPH